MFPSSRFPPRGAATGDRRQYLSALEGVELGVRRAFREQLADRVGAYPEPMDLRALLDLCVDERADDWRVLPAGPADHMVTGLVDIAAPTEPPALAALQPMYRAVYVRDARLGLAWGIPKGDWRDERETPPPAWMPEEWNSARPRYAVVLLNGCVVWQILHASVDWGAGISGYLPWPSPRYAQGRPRSGARQIIGWSATSWDAAFARLLTRIAGHSDFRSRTEEVAAGMLLEQRHPLGD